MEVFFMDWEPDALKRLERVPFFIRDRVKQTIEAYTANRGGRRVTAGDVAGARREFAGGPTVDGQASMADLLEKGALPQGLKSRCHEVRVCGGAHGCPLSLMDDRAVSRRLFSLLEEYGPGRRAAEEAGGPVLFHHKFRVALSGCPNACSQPQITDFGAMGQSRPARGEDPCSGCRACLERCREEAIQLGPEGPVFDYARCVNCGSCIRACPCGAIAEEWRGFKLLAGGKLGRHPRLADTLLDTADEEQLARGLKGALRLFREQGLEGERFAGLVERLGIQRVRESIFPRV
jgi:dissimilatory sulfite reductase (desulfoviridin) alpha/beta subunit